MRIRIGFQLSISTLFICVVLIVGLALVYLSFDRAKVISRTATTTFIDRVAEHTTDRVDGQFRQALTAIDIMRQLPPIQSGALAGNRPLYEMLAALLRNHEQLYNLYVGYDDGRFLELDLLDRAGEATRAHISAPKEAAFRLTIIGDEPGHGNNIRHTLWLSEGLDVITEATREADYDPRQRPWFRGAFDPDAGAVTEPYVFKGVPLTGYTVRAPLTSGARGIVAGDILLDDTNNFLAAQKLGLSGTVLLFDDASRVIAHPRMKEFLRSAPFQDGTLQMPHLSQVEQVDIGPPAAAWRVTGNTQQFFETLDGRLYVAAFRSVATAGSANLRLAVVAPVDEFFSAIESERRNLLLLTLAFVGATIPMIVWIGSRLSRSVRALSQETDRIRRFEIGAGPKRVRSLIREIDDLGQSLATMSTVVQTFARYVPKRLVEQLVQTGTGLRLGGSRRQVTVLFSDVAGFTKLAERADPEELMAYTSRYFAALAQVISAYGGTVDKFVGDSVMAIWNAPIDDPDHVANACAAALACREVSQKLSADFAAEGWPEYRTRFGLHTGEAVVGNIGSDDRMSYTVLGATVNLAARLETLNKEYGTEILVSNAVVEQGGRGFSFQRKDRVRPHGFDQAFEVFELTKGRGRTKLVATSDADLAA